jgi:prepilin-type N-terminal cleavage/methylation domain-containing protein
VSTQKPITANAHSRRLALDSRGFSLLEMMVALAILTVVIGIAVAGLIEMQRRSFAERSKTDTVQESRDFVDQMVRDIHDVGYPPGRVQNLNPSCVNNATVACGLILFSSNFVKYEGDLDGSGTVDQVWLQLQAGPGGKCPCKLQRGVIPKSTLVTTPGATPIYFTEVDGVLNSGDGAGGNLYGVSLSGPGDYSSYANSDVFAAYDMNGGAISSCSSPPPLGTPPCSSIRSLQISANVASSYPDPKTNIFAVYSITSKARVNNAVIDGPAGP